MRIDHTYGVHNNSPLGSNLLFSYNRSEGYGWNAKKITIEDAYRKIKTATVELRKKGLVVGSPIKSTQHGDTLVLPYAEKENGIPLVQVSDYAKIKGARGSSYHQIKEIHTTDFEHIFTIVFCCNREKSSEELNFSRTEVKPCKQCTENKIKPLKEVLIHV